MYLTNKLIEALPKRFVSSIVDLFSMALMTAFLSLIDELFSSPQEIKKNAVYVAIISFSFFLNKDIYFGKSFGKYFNSLRVVSARTGNAASPIQCAIRNLFLLIWPLEAIILFFSPEKRIGDIVAGTNVQETTELGHETKWQYIQAIISIVTSFIFVYFLFTYIDSFGFMS